MQRKVLFRLIFIALITGTCVYYLWVFQKHLRSSSDPIEFLPTEVDGLIKVNDGEIFLNYLRQDSLPLKKDLFADWSLWMNWKKENPIVSELMNGQCAYWVHFKMGEWYLFLPIPDRWDEDRLSSLIAGIPNLMRWEGCLVWIDKSGNIPNFVLMDEVGIANWRGMLSKSDKNAPFSFVGVSEESRISLDYKNDEWIGFVQDDKWLSKNHVVQMEDSLLGTALSTVWLASNSDVLLKQNDMKKRVFSLDTLCQCNVLESWVSWQSDQWKFQTYDGKHWVASQLYTKNPLKAMSSFLKDTTSKVIASKHPNWMPTLAESIFPIVPKYMSKRQGRIFVSDDSLSIHKAVDDTARTLWKSDFSGYADSRYSIFQGDVNQFPGLSQFQLSKLVYPRLVGVVVVKNNGNWLLRIAPVKE